MRFIICLVPLLFGCSAHNVRCDAHLQPINPPLPRAAASMPAPQTQARGQARAPSPSQSPALRAP